MFYLDIKGFLNNVCQEIKYKPIRKGIADELENHIQEIKEEYRKGYMIGNKVIRHSLVVVAN